MAGVGKPGAAATSPTSPGLWGRSSRSAPCLFSPSGSREGAGHVTVSPFHESFGRDEAGKWDLGGVFPA